MRLVQTEGASWGYLEEAGDVRVIAGGLPAWAPRIAGGEGVWVLPFNGRRASVWSARFDTGAVFRRVLPAANPPPPDGGFAAVIGAPLTGRRNPLRSVAGYVLAKPDADAGVSLGPILVTREEFGDHAPPSTDGACGCCADVVTHLRSLDAVSSLRAGDVVLLGDVAPAVEFRRRLTPP